MINRVKGYEPASATPAGDDSASGRVSAEMDKALTSAKEAIINNPRGALAVSVLVGVALGWLIKRR